MIKRLVGHSLICLIPLALMAQDAPQVIPLWPNGAPGFGDRRTEPEQAASYWVKNIHTPSVTVFLPPKEKAPGAAVVICPGGGHRELGFVPEGIEAGNTSAASALRPSLSNTASLESRVRLTT